MLGERPFCEELKSLKKKKKFKSIHCPNMPHPRWGDGEEGGVCFGVFFPPNLKISLKKCSYRKQVGGEAGGGVGPSVTWGLGDLVERRADFQALF